jgi:thiol-disulfide isomerase/thioredoxin
METTMISSRQFRHASLWALIGLLAALGACSSPAMSADQRPVLINALPTPYNAPDFKDIETWINSPPLTIKALKGKVVLVDFWTYSCVNCLRTLPYLNEWDRKYRSKGLVIVGVHSPEFDFEKDPDNVKAAVIKNGIHYPVAMDNSLATWINYANHYWPAHYLIDRSGKVVYTHFGEGDYAITENNIRALLGMKAEPAKARVDENYNSSQTPETYLGSARAERFAGPSGLVPGRPYNYVFSRSLANDNWELAGQWKVENEKIIARSKGSALRLNFMARKVFLVLGSANGRPVSATIRINGKPVGANAGKDAHGGTVTVKRTTLYELVDQKRPHRSVLEIKSNDPGLEAYAFTFGS